MTDSKKQTGNYRQDNENDSVKYIFRISSVILITLLLLRFVPHFFPNARLWGFNHLVFLPDSFLIVFMLLTAVAVAAWIAGRNGVAGDTFAGFFSAYFFESKNKHIYRLIFSIYSAVLFIIFAAPTHFLGDGYALIGNLGSESGTFYKWSEQWITLLLTKIQLIFGTKSAQSARSAFQAVSIFSGLVSVWFYFMIADIITEDKIKKLLTFALLYVSTISLLFFGYVENYPLLWIPLSGFIYYGLRRTKSGKGLIPAGLFLLIGVAIHLKMAVFFPAFIFLVFCGGKGLDIYRRFKVLLWIITGLAAVGVLFVFISKYRSDLYFQNIFLPLFIGKDIYPEYAMFGWKHIVDILNQLLLLSPALPLLIYLSARNFSRIRNIRKSASAVFLSIAALFSLIFLLIIDPKLSMPRDWDLFSFATLGLNLLLISIMTETGAGVVKKLLPALVIYLIIAATPFFLVNLQTDNSIKYHEHIIRLDRPKALSSIIVLRDYHLNTGNKTEAGKARLLIDRYFPNEKRMDQAFNALDNGNISLAKTLLGSIKPDKYSPIYHNLLSMLNLYQDNFNKALEESYLSLNLRQYDPLMLCNHAIILSSLNRDNDALEALYKAYRLDSSVVYVLEGLATMYLKFGVPDSVQRYGLRLLEKDSTYSVSYFMMAKAYAQAGRPDRARPYYEKYVEIGKNNSFYDMKCAELRRLIGIE